MIDNSFIIFYQQIHVRDLPHHQLVHANVVLELLMDSVTFVKETRIDKDVLGPLEQDTTEAEMFMQNSWI